MQLVLDAPVREVHHPVVTPDDPQAWMHARIAGEITAWRDAETELGWPMVLVEAVRPGGERVLGAFYRFFHFLAGAVVAVDGDDARPVEAMLRRGRPDLRGDAPVVIAELWR